MNKTEKRLWELFKEEFKCKYAEFCNQNPFQVVYCKQKKELRSCRQCNDKGKNKKKLKIQKKLM